MNVVRYEPCIRQIGEPYAWSFADMNKHTYGEWVHIDDYMRLMGVIRKLRTKIEKKNRRSRKFREAGVSR